MLSKFIEFINKETLLSKMTSILIQIAIIVIISVIVYRFLNKLVTSYLDQKDTQQSKTVKNVAQSSVKYMVTFFALTAILALFNINLSSIIAALGIGGIAIGFGAQSLVKDVITGTFILSEDQFGVDDIVDINGYVGRVERIGFRTTLLRNSLSNDLYIIPNSEISTVVNKTKDFQKVLVSSRIKYHENTDEIVQLFREALSTLDNDERIISPISISVTNILDEDALNIIVSCNVVNHTLHSTKRDMSKIITEVKYENNLEVFYPVINNVK